MDDFERRERRKYEAGLQRCTDVAHEEYRPASKALDEAKPVVERLREQIAAVQGEAPAQAGTTVQDARTPLADLAQRLDRIVSEQIMAAEDALARKKMSPRRLRQNLGRATSASLAISMTVNWTQSTKI